MPVNSKKKGNKWENNLANWLRDNDIKAWKDGMSGGGTREKGDIGNNIDCTIESKAAKNIKLMEWWRQVVKSALTHGNQPVLFIHQDGMPNNEWLVVMHSEDWVDMMKKSLIDKIEIEVEQGDSREKLWAIQEAIRGLKKLEKFFK